MSEQINFNKLVPVSQLRDDKPEEDVLYKRLFERAREFLLGHKWCEAIEESYFSCGLFHIVALFLVRIKPVGPNVDEWLWVITGDLPSACISTHGHPKPSDAFHAYLYQLGRWIEAVEKGSPVDNLISVNVPPTKEWAERLKSRLEMLEEKIVPDLLKDFQQE